MKTNSSRVIEAAADYIETLFRQGKRIVTLNTFSGEEYVGTICQPEVHRYSPLKIMLTLIPKGGEEHQTFDLSDISHIEPVN
jgi:hypothetical protein